MKHILVLLGALLCAPVALADDADIWRYQNGNGVSLADTCNDRTSCTLLYQNSHYVALINHRSSTGCQPGDLLIAEHKSRSYKQFNTGTCSLSASIEVGSENRMNTVDVVDGERLITRYPLDVWMWVEKHKEGTTVNWKKAEENAKKPRVLDTPKAPPAQWVATVGEYGPRYTLIQGQGNARYVLEIKCAYKMPGTTWPLHSELRYTRANNASATADEIEVDGKRLSGSVNDQAQWTTLVNAILSASTLSIYSGQDQEATWTVTPMKLTSTCDYYNG